MPSSDHDPRRDAAGRCRGDVHDRRRDGALEEPGRCRDGAAMRRPRSTCRRADRSTRTAWFLEALLATARQDARPSCPAARRAPRKLADLEVGTGAARADDHALGHHRHQHLVRCRSGPMRTTSSSRVTFGIAWLPEAYAGEQTKLEDGAGEGAGRAGAGTGQSAGHRAGGRRWRSRASASSTPMRRGSSPTRRWSSTRA